ncbi:MAG: BatA domain-containing protein [Planctomycetota bacterium]
MTSALFLNPAMLLGGLLIAIPIAIHLIHRFRYRRVRWAAMEFLLEGAQLTRRRIMLEQLLLLLLRCLVVLGIVLIIARPLASESVAGLFAGGDRSHHWIVLDDSYSMAESGGPGDCFSEAAAVLENLVKGISDRPGNHGLTLLRTSSPTPELMVSKADEQSLLKTRELLAKGKASYLATPPAKGILAAAEQAAASDASRKIVYVLTDFRAKDWPRDGELSQALRRMSEAGVNLQLIDAAPGAGLNLGIEQAVARTGSAAVGVPFAIDVAIRNYSNNAVSQVALAATVDGRSLPTHAVERIEPNAVANTTISLEVAEPGQHQVTISLPEDALARDNTAYVFVDLPERLPVLIIDGSKDREDSAFLSLALSPGGAVRTGLATVVHGPEYLAGGSLDGFRVVYLLNVPRLEVPAINALKDFVGRGGGLAIFLGDQVSIDDYNSRLFDETGAGLMPVRLDSVLDLPPSQDEEPDIQFEKHPIFKVFEGERNPFIQTVRVSKCFRAGESGSKPPTVKWIAKLRGGAPLAMDATIGNGRVVTFLTTAGAAWNNWSRNPSYVVAMLELYSYLARPVVSPKEPRVGEPWNLKFPANEFRRDVVVTIPRPDEQKSEDRSLDAELDGLDYRLRFAGTVYPGFYKVRKTRSDGSLEILQRSYNVEPAEGALEKLSRSDLEQRLQGVRYSFSSARDIKADFEGEGFEPRDWLLVAFLLALIGEQIWSGRLSYLLK